jgi:16S rRNA (cytosine1402-N4)-methyltransferase
VSGRDVLNEYSEEELAEVLWKYGEERNARRIAKAIVDVRAVDTTGALRKAVSSVTPDRFLTKTLARVFQAIRIRVNDELGNLEKVLHGAMEMLVPGGRLVAISYHSLEDRIVKEFFKQNAASVIPSGNKYVADTIVAPKLSILTKRPITASHDEVVRNPRARSAKLRAAERMNVQSEQGSQ